MLETSLRSEVMMKKQYITLDQFNVLKLSDHVLFIIDANVPADYLMKDFEVIKSDLESWRKDRKPLIKTNHFQYELIKKLNAIRMMQLVTDFINFSFWHYEKTEKGWYIQLFHDIDCEAPSADGEELIDVLYDLLSQTHESINLDFMGRLEK
ncbi:MAG: hypothetical protein JEZ08_24890 [Clostridiales bacterium]|nr:hypothetical protein [Clostridiales bacterium]